MQVIAVFLGLFLSGIHLLYLCLHGLCHSSLSTSHLSSVYFKLSPMKSETTNDSNYQAGDIITEDVQELDSIQKTVEVGPAEPENNTCEAEHGDAELAIVESSLIAEDMDGDEKKAQIYSPNRKPQNGGDNVTLYTKYNSTEYLLIVI